MNIRLLDDKAAKAMLLAVMAGSSFAGQKDWHAPPIVTTYCSGCHGIDGNSPLPYMPKLAGLSAAYQEKKLAAYKEPRIPPVDEPFSYLDQLMRGGNTRANFTRNERVNMQGVAHAAKADLIRQAVSWYSQQAPPRGNHARGPLVAKGEQLFRNGVPQQKILACMSCHGQNAQGNGPAPRLAGQNAQYIQSQLNKFRKGDRTHAPEMTMVSRDLDPEQARAVAVYLQSK